GEAVHYRERALQLGVPREAILIETHATNTAENFTFTRELLEKSAVDVQSVVIVSRPYQQRRAYATCRLLWPELAIVCVSKPTTLDSYVASIGDASRVINMLVGDTQRITLYAERGHAIPQDVPPEVTSAFLRLVAAGYTERLA